MPAKREDTTSPQRQRQLRRSRSSAAASSASPSPGARARRGLSVRRARARRARRRDLARGRRACSRRWPRPTPASGRCSSSACAARGAGRPSPRSWARSAASTSAIATCGTLMLARDRDEAEALERERDAARALRAARASALLPSAARRLEPALAPTLRSALHLPDDHAVDPRRVCAALARAARARRRRAAHRRRGRRPRRAAGRAGRRRRRAVVGRLRRRGARAPGQGPVAAPARPAGPGLLERVVRWGQPSPGYLVPRGDGRYVLGATAEERGFDTAVTAGGAARAAARRRRARARRARARGRGGTSPACVPARPTTPRSSAARSRDPRIVWATGHYRNGVLLAPVTADLVVAELAGEPIEHAFGPDRFAGGRRA